MLSRQDIVECTSARAFERGQRYFEQGRVRSLRIESLQPELILGAITVGGSEYRQRITVGQDEYGTAIDGKCTCPVAYNCKHVVAACLAFMHGGAEGENDADAAWIDSWLARVAAAGEAAPSDERLVWVLSAVAPESGSSRSDFELEPRIARVRPDGSLSRGRALRLTYLAAGREGVNAEDIELARLLHTNPAPAMLSGRRGGYVLEALLRAGRVYWQDLDAPLREGGVRTLELRWERTDTGGLRLQAGVHGGLLLPTEPAAYVDPVGRCMGGIETGGLSPAQLALIENGPEIPLTHASRLSAALTGDARLEGIPPPPYIPTRRNRSRPAHPRVRLASGPRPDQPHFHVEFVYGHDVVPAMPRERITSFALEHELVEVERDLDHEATAIAELLELTRLAWLPSYYRAPEDVLSFDADPALVPSLLAEFMTRTRARLEAAGWRVIVEPDFVFDFSRGEVSAEVSESTGFDWFDLGFQVEVNGETLPLLPLVTPLLHYDRDALPEVLSMPVGDGRFVTIPTKRLRPILDLLTELFDRPGSPGAERALTFSRYDSPLLTRLDAADVPLRGSAAAPLAELAHRLADFQGIERVPPPAGLRADLRPYQKRGLDWLQFLRSYRLGGVLADDMGLGKTLQTLAHLLVEKRAGRLTKPALVIAPTSVISNWRSEARRFAPDLEALMLHGPARSRRFAEIPAADIVLTTYALLPRDADTLLAHEYHSVILDEAQWVKNPRAKAARAVRAVRAEHRICLTGTPMENHLGELWAHFDFLMPGFLGDARQFGEFYRRPIERAGNEARLQALRERLRPFVLRRTKAEVATELPPKTEIIQRAEFAAPQAELYESIRIAMDAAVRRAIAERGLARSHLTILDALLKLRQVCCDPRLLPTSRGRKAGSAKLELLLDLLPTQLEEGRRVLLFSQFTSMLDLIREQLDARAIPYTLLTGRTRKRDQAIERFRSGEVDLFLISLKAGGVGLNLPEADTVIHYDPWWNPAVENQATDRAHRIGQQNPVFVYKLIAANTVEERILELQARKQRLADATYAEQDADETLSLDAEALAQLFSLGA